MILRRLLSITILLTSTIWSQAQQINPVPDYVFRNQMSVGRNAVTDTAAYFSIGPRYGATKGFMPPIVGDTATFSSGKRNGLLIFSVQKNKFLYWDSVRVQWSDMAGSSGSYIVAGDTASMLAPYLRKADTSTMLTPYVRHAGYGLTKSGQSFLVDTLNIATRAWRQKGLDSLAALEVSGSGTTNYVPKFTASGTIGNSVIYNAGGLVGINTASPVEMLSLSGGVGNTFGISLNPSGWNNAKHRYSVPSSGDEGFLSYNYNGSAVDFASYATSSIAVGNGVLRFSTGGTNAAPSERMRIFANGRVFIGASPTDAGYQLDINGNLRTVNGANFATTSGNVLIGTATASSNGLLQVNGNIGLSANSQVRQSTNADGGTLQFFGTQFVASNLNSNSYGYTGGAFMASVTNNDNLTPFEAGRIASTGGKFKIVNTTSENTYISLEKNSVTTLYANTSNGNVGIGTTSPAQKLDVSGVIRANSGTIYAQASGTESSGYQLNAITIGYDATAAIGWITAGGAAARTNLVLQQSGGEVLIGTASDAGNYKLQVSGNIYGSGLAVIGNAIININSPFVTGANIYTNGQSLALGTQGANLMSFFTNNTERGRINSAGEWIIDASGTDAGDYKLQVVGNARIGTGKLDIASNTTFGLGVARSGTSEVAGQIYNSNGILYLGAESSAGGQIFSGSSAYAAVIGSGANYPLQFAVNNITRGGFSTSGNLLLGFTTDSYFLKLQVNGSIFSNNQFFGQGANAQLSIDSSTNISPIYVSNQSLTGTSAQAMLYSNTTWNTTGNPSLLDLNITNTASGATSNYIKITDGTNTFRVTKAAEVVTAAPTGGSIRRWKLGEAATVSPTSPNRTIRVEIDGTVYYLHAKTTND